MPDILVIDDEQEVLTANVAHFTGLGYNVTAADTGATAIARLSEKQYDCIVPDFAARYIGVIDNEYGTGYRLIPPGTEGPI